MSDYTVVYLLTWLSVILGLTSFAATLIVLDSNWWRSRRGRRAMRRLSRKIGREGRYGLRSEETSDKQKGHSSPFKATT